MKTIDLSLEGPDLSRHGIVEAHAGTGKTWTVVNRLVLPFLVDGPPGGPRGHVRELVIATYTEKAAGELRERIRAGLESAIASTEDPSARVHLDDCLKTLGEAWIGTIHGISLRLLQSFPFETGMPFRTEIVSDSDGLEDCLQAALVARDGPWRSLAEGFRESLAEEGLQKLLGEALEIAKALMAPDAEVDLPTEEESRAELQRLESEARPFATRWIETVQAELVPELAKLASLPKQRKIKNLLEKWQALDPANPPFTVQEISSTKKGFPDFDAADPVQAKAMEVWKRAEGLHADLLGERVDDLAEARECAEVTPENRAKAAFLESWARWTVDLWKGRKRREGLLSYADMLGRLVEAMGNEAFLREIRGRVRMGIVDEFQDTSREQWSIFRKWFLGSGGTGRLFLVGDPKQSIYSFQGADVSSYREACGEIAAQGALKYILRRNFRSLPEVVEGVNQILLSHPAWFGDPSWYTSENRSLVPERVAVEGASRLWGESPVRLFRAEGTKPDRMSEWADVVADAVGGLRGTMVRLPEGPGWRTDRLLDWGDFAVVVHTRKEAAHFEAAFDRMGIPWTVYKQAGVFASRSAWEWIVFLRSLGRDDEAARSGRLAAVTRMFGVDPAEFRPEVHLDPCGPVQSWLERWRTLAAKSRWAEVLESARRDTGWENRILAGPDPDRQWMDHRQVRCWVQEQLQAGEGGPAEVARRLARLAKGDETESGDKNLVQRATDRERVQILTMHASKGLEFPVVFLGGGSNPPRQKRTRKWIDPAKGTRVRPSFLPEPVVSKRQTTEEDRRLLYVAMTRAQLLCGVPCFREKNGKPADRLAEALGSAVCGSGTNFAEWPEIDTDGGIDPRRADEAASTPRIVSAEDRSRLGLARRIVRQASFSAVVRGHGEATLEGRVGRSEEDSAKDIVVDPWLPKGARTGDALHEAIEALLAPDADPSWALAEGPIPDTVVDTVRKTLLRAGLGSVPALRVADLLKRLLAHPLALPGASGIVRLAEIPARDRRCEVEFHRAVGRDGSPARGPGEIASWVVGHLDFLFRVDKIWYIADWKSNWLPDWSRESIAASVASHRYDLQAAFYADAFRTAWPGETLGGGAWIYLRGLLDGCPDPVWTCRGSDLSDSDVAFALKAWMAPSPGGYAP